jgi:hypothetical protein
MLGTVYSTCYTYWCKLFNINDYDLYLWTFKIRIFILPFTKEHLCNVKSSHLVINTIIIFQNNITLMATSDLYIQRQSDRRPKQCS